MQKPPNVGHTPATNAMRDAIHVAIAPIEAAEGLEPSMHVEIIDGEAYESDPARSIGIVDPFLQDRVCKGERFWLFVLPNTVQNLRHCWSHPAFALKVPERKE
jgi:hypothetical protein